MRATPDSGRSSNEQGSAARQWKAIDLRTFLVGNGLFTAGEAYSVEELGGGVSSNVVLVRTRDHCYVVKQALPRLRVQENWEADPIRSCREARFAEVVHSMVPGSVPRVLAASVDESAFVMECAPADAVPWKAQLLNGLADPAIGRAAGRLLGRVHRLSAGKPEIAADFDRSLLEALRLEPYFRTAALHHPDIATVLEDICSSLLSPRGRCALVHGDFSPKNMLVTAPRRVVLVDHEVAHWGAPSFDVAFLLSHLALKAVHRPHQASAYRRVATAFLSAYQLEWEEAGADILEESIGLTAGLILARVDGKSRVEYLSEDQRSIARQRGRRGMEEPPLTAVDLIAPA